MKRRSLKKIINLIYNFSSVELTKPMESLLNKGLNFCPSSSGVNLTQVLADLYQMERKMAWRYIYFDATEDDNDNNTENTRAKFPFPDNRKKTYLPKEYPEEIKTFVNSVKSDLIGSKHKKVPHNLTKDEKDALAELIKLQKEGFIVIQPADKNGGIVIMNRDEYVDEAKRQLEDTLEDDQGEKINYYKKTKETEVAKQFKEVEKILNEGVENGFISKEQS